MKFHITFEIIQKKFILYIIYHNLLIPFIIFITLDKMFNNIRFTKIYLSTKLRPNLYRIVAIMMETDQFIYKSVCTNLINS